MSRNVRVESMTVNRHRPTFACKAQELIPDTHNAEIARIIASVGMLTEATCTVACITHARPRVKTRLGG